MADGRWTIDVSDETFEREVIERSRTAPVVVDFWAPWCAPCRTLGPMLEKLAEEHAGAFVVAKLNVDENPVTARAAGVQSIPLVLGLRDGQVVSEFVGAQPLGVVKQFLARLLPDEADRLAGEAEALAASGDAVGAEQRFRDTLAKRPQHGRASLGLGRLLVADGREREAIAVLENAQGADAELTREIDGLLATLRVKASGPSADERALRDRLAAEPGDLQARLDLGRMLAAAKRHEEALAELLEVLRRDRSFADDAARKAMIDIITLLGRDHPVADRYQRELSAVLFR